MKDEQYEEQIREQIKALIRKRNGWDLPADLRLMYLDGGRFSVGRPLVDERMWKRFGDPVLLLEVLTDSLPGSPLLDLLGSIHQDTRNNLEGVVYIAEAWLLQTAVDAPKAFIEQAERDGRDHKIHTRPDKIEIVMGMVQTPRGIVSYHSRRDGVLVPQIPMSIDQGGRVPDAMRAMFRNLKSGGAN